MSLFDSLQVGDKVKFYDGDYGIVVKKDEKRITFSYWLQNKKRQKEITHEKDYPLDRTIGNIAYITKIKKKPIIVLWDK